MDATASSSDAKVLGGICSGKSIYCSSIGRSSGCNTLGLHCHHSQVTAENDFNKG